MESLEGFKSVKVSLSDGTVVLMSCGGNGFYDGEVTAQALTIGANKALGAIKSLSTDLKRQLQASRPDKATVEFSIELEKSGNDIISKICSFSGKGGIKVSLEWDFSENKST